MAFCRLLGGRRMLSCNGSFRVLLQQNTREGPSTGPMETTSPSLKLKQSFQLLGLNQGECSLEDIKKAYISLAKKHHPDSNLLGEAADQFFRVSSSFLNHLTNPILTPTDKMCIHTMHKLRQEHISDSCSP